jgi:effector-binding domain-containing protein
MDLYIEVKIVEKSAMKILSARQKAAAETFEDRYAALYRKAFQKRLQVVGAPIAIYHNEHFDGQLSDVEAALPVDGKDDEVKELPGGTYACTVHKGPHGTLPITYALMGVWMEKNGYHPRGAPFSYLVRGGNDKILPAEQYLTEVYFPIEKDEELPDFDFGEDFGKDITTGQS